MTNKEPFAKLYDGDSDKPVILLAGGSFRIDCPKDDGERMVTFLNAAHEARVKEAVEAFKEKAVKLIVGSDIYGLAEHGKPSDRPEILNPNFSVVEWLADRIRKA